LDDKNSERLEPGVNEPRRSRIEVEFSLFPWEDIFVFAGVILLQIFGYNDNGSGDDKRR
jgi:hypothetical protein